MIGSYPASLVTNGEVLMSTGKKKQKSKNKPKNGVPIVAILAGIAGMLIVSALLGGGYYVYKQRHTVSGYDVSIARVNEVLRTRDPETPQGAVKLSEIDALVTGNPTVTRETKDGADYSVYKWKAGTKSIGFRLKLEKNGSIEEVVELATLGLD